jgi:uncharacterized protein YdeI (BOF family)
VKLLLPLAGFAMVVLAGCNGSDSTPGCTMGKAPADGPIVSVADVKPVGAPVTVHGTMIEKCPVAGCWFMLRDKSGVIKVDTKNAGFVVSDVPVNTEVTVSGVAAKTGERRIAAIGMRY